MTTAIFLVCMLVFFVVIVVVVGRSVRASGRRREDLLLDLRGLAQPHFHKDNLFAISVPVPTQLNFFLRAESDHTRSLRKDGRLTEQQTGVSGFDAQIFLECDDPKLAQWLSSSEPARKLVLQLVSGGRTLELSGKTLRLAPPDCTPGRLGTLATSLKELAQQVPRVDHLHPQAQAMAGRILLLRLFAGALLVLALVAGLQLLLELDDSAFPQQANVLPLLLAAGLVGAALGWLLHRGCVGALRSSSRVPRLSAELVVTLWLPVIALSVLGARYANLHGTHAAEQESVVRLDNLYSKRHRRSTSHYMDLGSIDEAGLNARTWRSSAWLNQQLAGIDDVRVRWRHGWLGSVIISGDPQPVEPFKAR